LTGGSGQAIRLATVLALALALTSSGAASHRASSTGMRIIAGNLDNPRKIWVERGGALDVVEAGSGGRARCAGAGANRFCLGWTGAIARVASGRVERAVTGFWSGAFTGGRKAQGPAAVVRRGDTYFVLLQDGEVSPNGSNGLGPFGGVAGSLVSTPGGHAEPAVVANLAAFEAVRNPDHGAGSGKAFGNPPIDSDPYAFVPYRGGFAIVDAAANDLLWIAPDGRISVLAVFPVRSERLSPRIGKLIGAPAGMRRITVQAVPSSVTVGPDGALYVGELSGVPFTPGTARVWRVMPGHGQSVYASGLTTISDLAFNGRKLLVLEMTTRGLLSPPSPGALVEIVPNGRRRVIASKGLVDPTGLAVSGDSVYISNYGLSPGRGPGVHGQLVSLPAPR
jgi:hypothetical protein